MKTHASNTHLRQYIPYLHGQIEGGEDQAACHYEYARTSPALLEAAEHARKHAPPKRAGEHRKRLNDECFMMLADKHGPWIGSPRWREIWLCENFPRRSWNQLRAMDRKHIAWHYPPLVVQPLAMTEARYLDSMGIFNRLKALATEANDKLQQCIRESTSTERVYPVLHDDEWTRALFTLDFTKTKARLLKEFEAWLDLPENKERLARYRKEPTGTTGSFKDALKKLAEWKLFEALGFDEARQFAEDHRAREHGKPLAFLNAHPEQGKKLPKNQLPLWSDERVAFRAKDLFEKHRAELLPCEFGEFVKREERDIERRAKIFREQMKAGQITKKDSLLS